MVSAPTPLKASALEKIARQVRGKLVELSHKAKTPHLGGSLSCVDILVALYWNVLRIDPAHPQDPARDRFILSKGHAAPTLYTTLAFRKFFLEKQLDSFTEAGSLLPEQPLPNSVPGVEVATGSLGHGLSMGLGMALASRITGVDYRVFVVLSDGECEEGSVWEAALLAPAQHLDNLVVIVDYNKWQATGRSSEVMALDPFFKKWETFGWEASEVNGHDMQALLDALSSIPKKPGKPTAIVAHTTKGKGVSFMEDDNNWHYRSPDAEEVKKAKAELGLL